MASFDLNILPIHRQNGQDFADLPGLLAFTPPRKPARGREKDNLVLYLTLSGNSNFSAAEIGKLTSNAANLFYQAPGSLTSAMRKTVEHINTVLHEKNLASTGQRQYTLGLLVLAVVRENQCTLSISGPAHVVWVSDGQHRHIHDPALSGKGLGSGQNIQTYLSQVEFQANDLIVLCGKFPKDWEADLLNERPPASLDASYRKLTITKADLNAVLINPQGGNGTITVLRPDVNVPRSQPAPVPTALEPVEPDSMERQPDIDEEPSTASIESNPSLIETIPLAKDPIITEDELDVLADMGVHMVQPSAYAIPPQPESSYTVDNIPAAHISASSPTPTGPQNFPPSIPRLKPAEAKAALVIAEAVSDETDLDVSNEPPVDVVSQSASLKPEKPGAHAEAARQMAKVMAGSIKTGRQANERFGLLMRNFIPKLLPGTEANQTLVVPTYIMVFMAVIIPLMVAVISWIVYSKYGLSETFYALYQQALVTNSQYANETDPSRQRDILNEVLIKLDQAEQYRVTDETKLLRAETQKKLDNMMGVIRLEFIPAFTNGIGSSSTQISRMAASESDLYMLDADRGNILHANFTGRTLEPDNMFDCQPGTYGPYTVGPIVDVIALPKINAMGATVMGIDGDGNLLYCAPGQVPQGFPLPPLPNTNWGRITAFAMDNGNLYVLDAESRAVWVYLGKDGSFSDPPYFFFGNQIPQSIETAIDLAVNNDDLYMLHADSHLSTCNFSRLDTVPTRCVDPAPLSDNFNQYPAHRGIDIFAQAHFTQISVTTPPNPIIMLLDSENQSVFRITPRSLELQNQIKSYPGNGNPFPPSPIDAMAISPNYVLYLAIDNQVYYALNLP